LGWLWLNHGSWGEDDVLPASLFDACIRPGVPADLPRTKGKDADYLDLGSYGGGTDQTPHGPGVYGFNFWFNRSLAAGSPLVWPSLPADAYQANGMWNRDTVTVIPSLQMVVTVRGAKLGPFEPGKADGAANQNLKLLVEAASQADGSREETSAGWLKYENNPVLGGSLGTCFDVALLRDGDRYRMWFSWRLKESAALTESVDGMHWSDPVIALKPNRETGWEYRINRPVVVKNADGYHMWYTGQSRERSWIGYARSADGVAWRRMSPRPVISADEPWEKVAVMSPHVIWDEQDRQFRMWCSGGEQYEPDAIGYATSPDGQQWTKHSDNPVFQVDKRNAWEQHKVTACQVVQDRDWYLMFYIGFRDEHRAQIGLARSRDGISNWERHPANPVISPGRGQWDHDACYKPFAIFDQDQNQWLLWYNGRRERTEQTGLAIHPGHDLGFPARDRPK
jgi:beta-1,2-mannobiose phosphorylase / 1,2-beta-oligomannan phosphorylase